MQRLTTIGRVFVFAGCCGLASAQASLADLQRAATSTQQEWFELAASLDTRLTRMLPCDRAASLAIDEVHRASTARLTALILYTRGVADQAAQDVAMAQQIQKSESDYATGLAGEKTDTGQERAGIVSQLTNLTESVRKRVSLTVANDELRELEASVRDRANLVAADIAASESALPKFQSLVQALEYREAALRKQIAALQDELAKWNGYYAARLSRLQVECLGTGR